MKYLIFDIDGVLLTQGRVNEKMVELCRQLTQKGYRLGIIFNYSSVPREISDLGLFYPILYYGQTRLLKPDSRLYQKFIDLANVSASDCLLIDDSRVNVHRALDFGMDAIYFVSQPKLRHELILKLGTGL